jgi:hypothetical protein
VVDSQWNCCFDDGDEAWRSAGGSPKVQRDSNNEAGRCNGSGQVEYYGNIETYGTSNEPGTNYDTSR